MSNCIDKYRFMWFVSNGSTSDFQDTQQLRKMLRGLSCGYILYERNVVCNGKIEEEKKWKGKKKNGNETKNEGRLRVPEMEEEEETRSEAARWLRSRGKTLLREPPPYNTPPPTFILCLLAFSFSCALSLLTFAVIYFTLSFFGAKKTLPHKMRG